VIRHHLAVAALIALATVGVGLEWSTRVAAGSDAYGYVSQADLWLRGNLFIDQSFAATVPWPLARWTFTPLGYVPERDGYRIVPRYPPGVPLMMAAAKSVAGQCALFAVVPWCGGLLVFSTYAIARRIGRPIVGVAAAAFVATSPSMLFMLMQPMSDVPAAAAWSLAIACALGDTTASAVGAGVSTAIAILIRPNTAPLAAVIGAWLAFHDPFNSATSRTLRVRLRRPLIYAAIASVGAIAVAMVNARIYGSPLSSGYGDLSDAYVLSYLLPNLQRYPRWLVSVETPLALAGVASLFVPNRRVWPTPSARRSLWLFAPFTAAVWMSYLFYVPYDAWWYLRFLLPSWPLMALGTASLAAALFRGGSPARRAAALAIVGAVIASGVAQARRREIFSLARVEAKYVQVANVVETITTENDIVITSQYSGSLRYYAGRLTLQWESLDGAWLDRAVAWLAARGHRVYLVLEETEVEPFRTRFAARNSIGRVDWLPLVSFRGGAVKLYDAVRRDGAHSTIDQREARPVRECVTQRTAPPLR
jgi:hypothetical protein